LESPLGSSWLCFRRLPRQPRVISPPQRPCDVKGFAFQFTLMHSFLYRDVSIIHAQRSQVKSIIEELMRPSLMGRSVPNDVFIKPPFKLFKTRCERSALRSFAVFQTNFIAKSTEQVH
jgi:hypothetical protein